jgi:hypothetical protein
MSEAATEERWVGPEPLAELKPHPANARTHKLKELSAAFDRFDFAEPVLVCERTGYIAAGHGRREVLMKMKAEGKDAPEGIGTDDDGEWQVPVIHGWSSKDDDELRAYLIADNRHPELSGWDIPTLAEMAPQMKATELGLMGTGLTLAQLDKMIAPAPEPKAVGQENDYGQRADHYRNKNVRSIIFDYPIADYEFVTTTAKEAAKAFDTETFAELFVAMLMGFEELHPEPEAA